MLSWSGLSATKVCRAGHRYYFAHKYSPNKKYLGYKCFGLFYLLLLFKILIFNLKSIQPLASTVNALRSGLDVFLTFFLSTLLQGSVGSEFNAGGFYVFLGFRV